MAFDGQESLELKRMNSPNYKLKNKCKTIKSRGFPSENIKKLISKGHQAASIYEGSRWKSSYFLDQFKNC